MVFAIAEQRTGACVTRSCRVLALCLAGTLTAVPGLCAADVVWETKLPAAAASAQKQGKLLLIVQHTGDFTADPTAAKEARLYQSVTLADRAVEDALAERFVLVCQAVGPPASFRQIAASKARTTTPAKPLVLTYICLPDQRLLHCIPGFISSAELLAELAWAERAYHEVCSTPAEKQSLALRDAHLAKLAVADLALFSASFTSRWHEGALKHGPSTVELPQALAAAKATLVRSLAARSMTGRSKLTLSALGAHGSVGVELTHLALAEFPLVDLADFARPAFEACAERRYWESSVRASEIAAWWATEKAAGRPVLLVVGDDPFATRDEKEELFAWPPRAVTLPGGIERFTTRHVSLEELAQLVSDADLDPLTYAAADGPPRFLIYDGAAKPSVRISRREGLTRLTQAIAAFKSRALEVKVAAGGADDERD